MARTIRKEVTRKNVDYKAAAILRRSGGTRVPTAQEKRDSEKIDLVEAINLLISERKDHDDNMRVAVRRYVKAMEYVPNAEQLYKRMSADGIKVSDVEEVQRWMSHYQKAGAWSK